MPLASRVASDNSESDTWPKEQKYPAEAVIVSERSFENEEEVNNQFRGPELFWYFKADVQVGVDVKLICLSAGGNTPEAFWASLASKKAGLRQNIPDQLKRRV